MKTTAAFVPKQSASGPLFGVPWRPRSAYESKAPTISYHGTQTGKHNDMATCLKSKSVPYLETQGSHLLSSFTH